MVGPTIFNGLLARAPLDRDLAALVGDRERPRRAVTVVGRLEHEPARYVAHGRLADVDAAARPARGLDDQMADLRGEPGGVVVRQVLEQRVDAGRLLTRSPSRVTTFISLTDSENVGSTAR